MIPEPENVEYFSFENLDSSEALLVDVRIREAFEESHVPGSINVCVYEISFAEQVEKLVGEKSAAIVVYGDGDPFKADLAAVGRLRDAGFENVSVLQGGLTRWLAEGRATEGKGVGETEIAAGSFTLDLEKTKVRWIGRNLTNQHDGLVEAKGGRLSISAEGGLDGGVVTVDLTKMSCRDIEDASLAKVLIGHLQNADFFEVSKYPEASFEITSANRIEPTTYGSPNYKVSGVLHARGNKAEIELDAMLEAVEGGYVFQSVFQFDRTKLGAIYGSGRFFERLGMHLVNDLVTIDVAAFFKA